MTIKSIIVSLSVSLTAAISCASPSVSKKETPDKRIVAGSSSKKDLQNLSRGGADAGGGDAVLCYQNVGIRDQVVQDLQESKNPFQPVNLRLDQLENKFHPQLLDLYEGGNVTGFPGETKAVSYARGTAELVYERLRNIAKALPTAELESYSIVPNVQAKYLNWFLSNLSSGDQWIAEPLGVTEIDDATFSGKFPRNCLVAQVAFYNDQSNMIHYDQRIVALMTPLHREALRVHEDLYKLRRRALAGAENFLAINRKNYLTPRAKDFLKDRTSNGVRSTVRQLFTKEKIDNRTIEDLVYLVAKWPDLENE